MATPLTLLEHQAKQSWLIGYDAEALLQLAQQRYQELRRYSTPTIFLAESDPLHFLAGFVAACSVPCRVFLCNPNWGGSEWQQVFQLAKPTVIWGKVTTDYAINAFGNPSQGADGADEHSTLIMIATGGTSGNIRFAMHTWETLSASVQGFREYFGCDTVNSFCLLPLYHVSGLMQLMRSLLSNGKLIILPWKAVEAGQRLEAEGFFLSLVPTQLQRLLPSSAAWLCQFRAILLGGAPAWDALLKEARSLRLPLAPTYGMTETASQIATLKPADFLNGQSGCGRVLPHAQIAILDHKISIQSQSLMLGYYPNFDRHLHYEPDDLGYMDKQGFLHLVGRESNKIITGGENVFPSEVESAIRSTELVKDIAVLGIRDRTWGQAIVAVYVPHFKVSSNQVQQRLDGKLSRYKYPKHWIAVKQLPRNAQGKMNQGQLQQLVMNALNHSQILLR